MAITELSREEIFLHFALQEIALAIAAFDEVDRLSSQREQIAPDVSRLQSGTVISSLRLALYHSAGASRVFWPPKDPKSAVARRCEIMRKLIGVGDSHPLGDRRLRNAIEHIDELIDKWTKKSPRPFTTIQSVLHRDHVDDIINQARASVIFFYNEREHEVSIASKIFDLESDS